MLRRNFISNAATLSLSGFFVSNGQATVGISDIPLSKPLDLFKEDKTELKTLQVYKITSDKNVTSTYQYFKEYSLTNPDYMCTVEGNFINPTEVNYQTHLHQADYVLVPLFKTQKYNTLKFQAKLDLLEHQNKLAGDCLLEFAKSQKEFKLDNSSNQLKNMTNSIKNYLGNDCKLFFHNSYMIGVAKSEFYKPCTDIDIGESCLSDNQTKVYFAIQHIGLTCINGKTAFGKIF